MRKICPRCSREFICRHDNVLDCECMTVRLEASDLEYIALNFSGCLCLACLLEIRERTWSPGWRIG